MSKQVDHVKPKTPIPLDNIWQFSYRRGPAFLSKCVRAHTEEQAQTLAAKWCAANGVLMAGNIVEPWIVADSTTSMTPIPVTEKPDAVASTTSMQTVA